jgi:hypothetical protein
MPIVRRRQADAPLARWQAVMLTAWVMLAVGCSSSKTTPTSPSTPSTPTLTIAAVPTNLPTYNRDDWKTWVDADGDCQDTRAEVLLSETTVSVTFRPPRDCVVDTGRWNDPYTKQTFIVAGDLDIDHLVPLANAHRSGAWSWTASRKEAYANDLSYPLHLIAVSASANRSKGDSGPEAWKPPNQQFWCSYATAWVHVKQSWSLTATQAEWNALEDMLGTCP